jgi:hypothetical protein
LYWENIQTKTSIPCNHHLLFINLRLFFI